MAQAWLKGSRLKIERAEKHITELILRCKAFDAKDFHYIRIEEDVERLLSYLCLDIDWTELQFEEFGPIIGDVVHNLRSALDLMYHQLILACQGMPSDYTKFPIFKMREDLENIFVNSALKQKQITPELADFILNKIRPYEAGNSTLWGLHQLNITDKHQVLVPTVKIMAVFDIRLEDENGAQIGPAWIIADDQSPVKINKSYRKRVVMKSKGRASSNIIFHLGCGAFTGEAVVPALRRIADEVTRTVDAFEASHLICEENNCQCLS